MGALIRVRGLQTREGGRGVTPQTLICQAGNAAVGVGVAVGSLETGEKALGVRQSSWVRAGLR